MADVIDELKVQIDASTKNADVKLDKFIAKMENLQKAVTGLSGFNASGFANGLGQLATSIQDFSSKTKAADFNRVAKGLDKLAAVNAQGLESTATAMTSFATSMTGLGQMSFNADNLTKMVNSVTRLGGANATQALTNLPQISTLLKAFIADMNTVGSVAFNFDSLANLVNNISRLGGAKATQAVKNLEPIKRQILRFVSGLNGIGTLSFDTTGLANLVSSITKLGGKAAGNAIPNIQNLGVALKNLMATLANAPVVSRNLIEMTTALANLAGAGGKVGSATTAMSKEFNLFSGSSKGIKSSSNGIAAAIGKVYATYWLLFRAMGTFRKAMDISSDLTEVQNVVDVTFGNMKKKIEDFASVSLSQYGMSALTAKGIASRYQAMGVAMGFSQKQMSGMSVELTKLAADMASFYNVEQKDVAKSLESIFTGQTRPMRTYGLDLTQATLKEWALNNGLNANIKSMSAAEKTWLRYQYVMANSQQVIGDFARTSDSWHNQLVLLTGSFQSLGSIVGGSLINAFKPFIQALNAVMLKVIQFAQVVSNALGSIFGWKYESGGGIADDFSDAADSADDLAGSTGDAAKNTKKMADNLQGFDKLNVISNRKDSGGSGSGSGGSSEIGSAGVGGQWVSADSLWEKYTSSIDTLYGLGEYIGDVLTKTLKSIDWDKVYDGAQNFGAGLANFLNGLISPQLFGSVGETIAGALNTVLHFLDSFGETFDWVDFGNSIAAGINGFFSKFDFALLAKTLNVWVDGLKTTIITAINGVSWKDVFKSIGEFLSILELDTVAVLIGGFMLPKPDAVKKELKKAILWALGIPDGKLSLALDLKFVLTSYAGWGLGGPVIDQIGNEIIDGVDKFIQQYFGESVLNAMGESLLVLVGAGAGGLIGGPIGILIGAGIGIALDSFVVKGEWITKFWDKVGKTIFNWDQTLILWDYTKQFFDKAFNADNFLEFGENIIEGIISGMVTAITWVYEPIGDLFDFIVEKICEIFGIHSPAKSMEPYGQNILRGIIEGFCSTFNEWTDALNKWYNNYIAPWFTQQKWNELYSTIKTSMKSTWNQTVGEWSKDINDWWTSNVIPWFTTEKWENVMSGVKVGFENAFNTAFNAVKQLWNDFAKWLNDKLTFDIKPVKIAGVEVFGGTTVNLGKLPTFETGGFPEDGLFMANHNELVGKFSNGQTAVANNEQITQGIAIAVQSANSEMIAELRRQNELLQIIANKPVIDKGDIVSAWKSGAKDFRKQTGRQLGIAY